MAKKPQEQNLRQGVSSAAGEKADAKVSAKNILKYFLAMRLALQSDKKADGDFLQQMSAAEARLATAESFGNFTITADVYNQLKSSYQRGNLTNKIPFCPGLTCVNGATGSGKTTFLSDLYEQLKNCSDFNTCFYDVSEPLSAQDFALFSFFDNLDKLVAQGKDVIIIDSMKDIFIHPVIIEMYQIGPTGLPFGVGILFSKLNRWAVVNQIQLIVATNPWITTEMFFNKMTEMQTTGVVILERGIPVFTGFRRFNTALSYEDRREERKRTEGADRLFKNQLPGFSNPTENFVPFHGG